MDQLLKTALEVYKFLTGEIRVKLSQVSSGEPLFVMDFHRAFPWAVRKWSPYYFDTKGNPGNGLAAVAFSSMISIQIFCFGHQADQ